MRASLGVGVSLGLVPGLGAMLELAAQRHFAQLGVGLTARYLPPSEQQSALGDLRLQAAGGSLTGHYLPLSWVGLGAGFDAYGVHAQGRGALLNTRSEWTVTLAARVESWVSVLRSSRTQLELGVAGLLHPQPPRFGTSSGRTLYEVARFGLQVGLRGGWDFLNGFARLPGYTANTMDALKLWCNGAASARFVVSHPSPPPRSRS